MSAKTFLMMGRPGCGKGTQSKLLAEKIGGAVYSTGEKLRAYAEGDTFFGKKTKKIIESGDLMPEWTSVYLFEEIFINLPEGEHVVFEGSGRKLKEAHTFNEVAEWFERPFTVVYLEASEEALRARLAERLQREGRADDALKAIELRFKRFTEHTIPAIEYFESLGKVVRVNTEPPIEVVHESVVKALGL